MFQRLLVPLDGSPVAERAIPVAARLAHTAHGVVIFCSSIAMAAPAKENLVMEEESLPLTGALSQKNAEVTGYLANVQARYATDLSGVCVKTEVVGGSSSETLASVVCRHQIEVVVTCFPRGEEGYHWSLECVASQGIHPLLLVVSDQVSPDGKHPLRVLLPLDGSLFSEMAIQPALQLLSQWNSLGRNELCLIRVIDLLANEGTGEEEAHMSRYTAIQAHQEAKRYLHTVVARLREDSALGQDVSITCLLPTSVGAAGAILRQIPWSRNAGETYFCYLVVMATHGHPENSSLNLESVAEHLVNETHAPLLLVPPQEKVARLVGRIECAPSSN